MSKVIKQMQMDALAGTFRDVRDLVVLSIKGLSAQSDNQFRAALRKKNIRLQMVKNSLARKVFTDMGLQITKAWEILQELSRSLDHTRGGELSRNLACLYSYIQQRLLDANAGQIDEPLAEAEKLLATLSEAWDGAKAPATSRSQEPYQPVSCRA